MQLLMFMYEIVNNIHFHLWDGIANFLAMVLMCNAVGWAQKSHYSHRQ